VDQVTSGQARTGLATQTLRLFRNVDGLRWRGPGHDQVEQAWLRRHQHRGQAIDAAIVHVGAAADPRPPREQDWRLLLQMDAIEELLPEHIQLLVQRTQLQLHAGDIDAAQATLQQAGRWPIEHPDLAFCAGWVHEQRAAMAPDEAARVAELQQAVLHYHRTLAFQGRCILPAADPQATGWLGQLRLGAVLVQLGRYEEAKGCYEQALSEDPDLLEARLGWAEALIGLGSFAQARQALEVLTTEESPPDARLLEACACQGLQLPHQQALEQAQARQDQGWVAPHRRTLLVAMEAVTEDEPSFAFIGGAGRSGTTLFRAMLHAHPRFHCGPEAKLVPMLAQQHEDWQASLGSTLAQAGIDPPLMERALRAYLQTLLTGLGPPGLRVAEKTPHNVAYIALLARIFPRARFIHLLRDGRAVATSLVRQDWTDSATGQPMPYCRDLESAARYWMDVVLRARQQSSHALGRVLELRYEDLVRAPEATMRRALEFLGEPWDAAVLEHDRCSDLVLPAGESSSGEASQAVYSGAVDRWREQLDPSQVASIEAVAGGLLQALGYGRPGPGPTRAEPCDAANLSADRIPHSKL